jgi:MFS family permease
MRRVRTLAAQLFEGLPTTFVWLFAGGFVSALANFAFPFLTLSLRARGFAAGTVGLVLSLLGFGILAAGPLSGYLTDRLGRRATLLGALVLASSSVAALAFVRGPVPTSLAAILFGLSSSAAASPIQAIVADLVPLASRPRAYALLYWASNLGTGCSLMTGGFLAARGWALPFLADASTTLLFALVVLVRVKESRPGPGAGRAEQARGGYRDVLRDRTFLFFLSALFPFALVFYQVGVTLPLDMARHGLSPTTYGAVLVVNTALVVLLQPFAPRLLSRFTSTAALALAAALVGLGYGGYALCASPLSYALATFVWSLGEIVYAPSASARVAELAPPSLRGRYAGSFAFLMGGAATLAPLLGTGVMQAFGRSTLFLACLGLGALSSGSLVLLSRAGRERESLAA